MDKPPLRIESWSDVPRVIAQLQLAGVHHRVPVLQALYAGRIGHWEPQRVGSSGTCKRFLAQVRRPALVIIGDDDDTPAGPGGWPVAQRLLGWARVVLIHAAGGHPEHYEDAVRVAEQFGRVLLIECNSATLDAWKAAADRWARGAILRSMEVPPPAVHPVPRAAGALH